MTFFRCVSPASVMRAALQAGMDRLRYQKQVEPLAESGSVPDPMNLMQLILPKGRRLIFIGCQAVFSLGSNPGGSHVQYDISAQSNACQPA